MAQSNGPSMQDTFNDAAAVINAYVADDERAAYVEIVMGMDDLEKFALIGALISLILNPTPDDSGKEF